MEKTKTPEQLFQELYTSSFKGVFRFFYYKSVQFDQIEELCQEVYLRFWDAYQNKLQDTEQCKRILYGIALNVYREWVRSNTKNSFISLEYYWENLLEEDKINSIDNWCSLEYDQQQEELKQKLRWAINQLPEQQRKVLEYRFIHGMTREETARKMNMPVDNVHTYQKRAIKSLKEILQEEFKLNSVPPITLN